MNADSSEPRPEEEAVKPALTPKRFVWKIIIIAILVALTVVGIYCWEHFHQSRDVRVTPTFQMCQSRLRTIDAAKYAWALEHNGAKDDAPTLEDLRPYFLGSGTNLPSCPEGGRYIIGYLDEKPKCSLGGHHALP